VCSRHRMRWIAMKTTDAPIPIVLPRSQHNVSRSLIDPDAVKLMYRLVRNGFKAYLVGGSVRDLLLGRIPKDYDVATDARPGEIKRLFHNCRIIGRRFRIVHVFFRDNKIIEVSTFRKDPDEQVAPEQEGQEPTRRGDNTFGQPHEDASRRDLTINGLFYDISTFSVIDYVGGIADLRAGIIRAVGDADERFREDPVRMIRAVRHAARTGFNIEPATYEAVLRNAGLLKTCNVSRLQDELQKDLAAGGVQSVFQLHKKMGLIAAYFPALDTYLDRPARPDAIFQPSWVWTALSRLDAGMEDPGLTPFYSLLSLLYPLLEEELLSRHSSLGEAQRDATDVHQTLKQLGLTFGARRKDQERTTTLWFAFVRMMVALREGRMPPRFRKRPYFHAVIQFYRFQQAVEGHPEEEISQRLATALQSDLASPRRRRAERRRGRRTTGAPEF